MTSNSNGLLLYFHYYSFYAQRVVLALHEKNLPFKTQSVDLFSGEQYEPWFLEINPRGEVPVLKDGVKIIPDSNRIVDYLEDNFSNGNTPRLIPLDQGPQVKQKVNYFRDLIDKVPANTVTMGCCYHSDLISDPRFPFIAPIRAIMKSSDAKASDNLRELADKYPQYKEILLSKAKTQEANRNITSNKDNFNKLLTEVDSTLQEVEDQLNNQTDDSWLVTDRFTIADVNLAILLERLSQVGLEHRLWRRNKPNVSKYYERVKTRDSMARTIPGLMTHLTTFIGGKVLAAVGTVAIAATIGGAIYCWRKSE